jgi:hypothetical protein
MIHGELIKWADDDVVRAPMTINQAVAQAAQARNDFGNFMAPHQALRRINRLDTQLDGNNYYTLPNNYKGECGNILNNTHYGGMTSATVMAAYNALRVKVLALRYTTVIDDAAKAKAFANYLHTTAGFANAGTLETTIQETITGGVHALINGYIYQMELTRSYFNCFQLRDVEALLYGVDGSIHYLDIVLTDGSNIEAKKYAADASLAIQTKFEQQLKAYARSAAMGILPGGGDAQRMDYIFDTSAHGVPAWAQAILEKYEALFPGGLYVNGHKVIKPRDIMSYFSKKEEKGK